MKLKSVRVYRELVLRVMEEVCDKTGESYLEPCDMLVTDISDSGRPIVGRLTSEVDVLDGVGVWFMAEPRSLSGRTGVVVGLFKDKFLSFSRSLVDPGVVADVPPLELRPAALLYSRSEASLAA